jgi:hypothetical protein
MAGLFESLLPSFGPSGKKKYQLIITIEFK